MGLLEDTVHDQRTGQPINSNLADYSLPPAPTRPTSTSPSSIIPSPSWVSTVLEVLAKSASAGVAAAITAAVHHATGMRVRQLPVHIEHLLQSKILEA